MPIELSTEERPCVLDGDKHIVLGVKIGCFKLPLNTQVSNDKQERTRLQAGIEGHLRTLFFNLFLLVGLMD